MSILLVILEDRNDKHTITTEDENDEHTIIVEDENEEHALNAIAEHIINIAPSEQ